MNDGTNTNYGNQISQSKNVRTSLQGISQLLNTGLTPDCLDICCRLIEAGVHPQALAEVIRQLRQKAATQKNEVQKTNCK